MNERQLLFRYVAKSGCQYVWRLVKNLIRLPLGRKPVRDDRLVFYRQYVLHKLHLRRIRAVTCALDDWYCEGPGSQALQIMRAIADARAVGFAYLHAPFRGIYHADRPMHEWVNAWETIFNLGAGEQIYMPGMSGVANLSKAERDFRLCFGRHDKAGQATDYLTAAIPEFRRKYYINKTKRTTDEITFAVNIRRGEVSAQENNYLYTATEKILLMANRVKSSLESRGVPFRISVYGQGSIDDFQELLPLGARFFLDADPIWTMRELVEADILLVAKSSFSYYAGIISDGIKVYELNLTNYWLPDVKGWDDWIRCEEDGSFDGETFGRRLSLLLEAKRDTAISEAS